MGRSDFYAYLTLLQELSAALADLTKIEQEKTQTVRNDDLGGLNECMKQEQALTMTLRGYEQKRMALLHALGLNGVPLNGLLSHAPEDCLDETKRTVEELRRQYSLFRGASEVARDTLECNLHQIEKILQKLHSNGKDGPGYQSQESQLPSQLRTDFRA
ncbi:MAG: flagellar protein FlgN [Intestinimonas sp.]|jgi:hypothetical protein|nr:flagellar protein FlgN [Intestinimonas sp.]